MLCFLAARQMRFNRQTRSQVFKALLSSIIILRINPFIG
ncbi:hypothetical protein yaldo0001_33800 [Yersinia aldovae ATCC 35236]|nr:hypothetical protein yaldo0001_33800 [Yersinia aldovae ATCC 35236]